MKVIDLNADLGEGMPQEPQILPLISSANICCGAHAGSPEITRATVKACLQLGIRIGAHPGYPDPEHFGRTSLLSLSMNSQQVLRNLISQVNLVSQATYIKPHGAFYNESSTELGGSSQTSGTSESKVYESRETEPYRKPTDEDMSPFMNYLAQEIRNNPHEEIDDAQFPASYILTAVLVKFRLPLMGLPFTYHEELAWFTHAPLIREGFIDRRYDNNHRLRPRSDPEAVIHDPKEAIDQALRLAETCDTLCVHGDNPNAPDLLAEVRQNLEDHGYIIKPK